MAARITKPASQNFTEPAVESPCVRLCTLGHDNVCVGCFRSLEEICAWGTASADEHAELFWGLRGGGGNFGVATSFEFALHEVGPMLYGGMALYPMDEAASVLAGAAEYREQAAREVGMLTAFTATPDGVPVLAVVAVYNGAVTTGETALAPLKRLGTPVADTFGALPYRQMQTLFDAGAPAGLRYYWKSSFLEGLPGAALSGRQRAT